MSSESTPTLIHSLVPESIRNAILAEGDVDCLRRAVRILGKVVDDSESASAALLRKRLGKNRITIGKTAVIVTDALSVLANILEDEAKEQTNTRQIIEGDIP